MAKDEIHEHFPRSSKHKEQNPMTNWVYDVFLWTFSILVDLFFREVHPRGSWKVPRHGPLIFVAAPHANQVCTSTLFSYARACLEEDRMAGGYGRKQALDVTNTSVSLSIP